MTQQKSGFVSSMRINNSVLSTFTGVLLWAAWPANGVAPLLWVAFIPLLIIEWRFYNHSDQNGKSPFRYFYFTFVLFNLFTTWWVWNASAFGVIMAIVLNSLFMATVFWLFYKCHKILKSDLAYFLLPVFWLSFEYMHMDWDLSWPWLTLANGWAAWYKCVQWYEFTGFSGGTIWTWAANIFLFLAIKHHAQPLAKKYFRLALSVIIFPLVLSYTIYFTYTEKINPVNIVVAQPNIDPYNEKFVGDNFSHIEMMLKLASTKIDTTTDYYVTPETAIASGIWEEQLYNHRTIRLMQNLVKQYPQLSIVTGAATDKFYRKGENKSVTARKFSETDDYYDSYNTALQIDATDSIQIYHKSKLVPGVEKMPFEFIFKHMEQFAIDLGGASGSLGNQNDVSVFKTQKHTIAPVICYESIYGKYVGKYVRKGADLIFIITNDGWWGNTPGYRQHLQYARLRAIEMRRSIARSANTGISCFINQKGDIIQQAQWWQTDVLKQTINANTTMTVYARIGDIIAIVSCLLSLIALLWCGAITFRNKAN
ncbi:MAG TPA: apolipoprotein N-acyltransferase [Bacteroidia bacterium]|nr:apolipoprotein N-acyltransferase [Bacteroidia bacterium]